MPNENWIQRLVTLLAAIKAITDALPDAGALTTIQADLDNPAQYMANLTTLETRLSAARAGFLDELAAANLPTDVAALNTLLSDATYGLAAIETLVDDLETRLTAVRAGYLDELDFNLQGLLNTIAGYLTTEIVDIIASQGRMLFTMDFWSDTQEELLVNATAANKSLPTVTVTDLPAGATIVRAIAMFKFRMVENVFAGANAINVAQHIQVRDDSPGTWRDAIGIADNQFNFTEAIRDGGDILIGDHDIAIEVDANDGYNFQWTLADADQISINFNDIQVGLRILYSV